MELKVISFNIRCCDDVDGNSIAERAPRLNELISKYDPDILGLQEYRPKWEEHFVKYFSEKYDIYSVPRTTKEGHPEAVPMLWRKDRFECLKKGCFWLSDTPEEESRGWDEKYNVNRICCYAVLKERLTGKTFTFMNTHFGFGDSCQTKSARLIQKYADMISSDAPTFCTGDFNMNSESLGYKEMVKRFTDVNAVTLKYDGVTFHGYAPEKYKGGPIDFCFINDGVTPRSCKIIDELVDGKYPSDHYGLYLELDI